MAIHALDGTVTVDRGGAGMAFGPGTAIWFAEGRDWAVPCRPRRGAPAEHRLAGMAEPA